MLSIRSLLQSKLVFVTGKGGTGKTTFAAALAKQAARSGRTVCLLEIDSQRPALDDLFDVQTPYEPLEVAEGLFVSNATWMEALIDWLRDVVPVDRLVRVILDNPMVRPFLEATPGAREVVILTRLLELTNRFDMVVVDLPASGHARAVLRIPLVALSVFRSGPVFERCRAIERLYQEPSTRLVLMSLPEEMVVTETLETLEALRVEVPALAPEFVVLNRAMSPVLTTAEQQLLRRLVEWGGNQEEFSREAADLVRAGRWEARCELGTAAALKRLQGDGRVTELLLVPPHPVQDSPAGRMERTRACIARAEVQERAQGTAG
jgi:anion-transporting  ArsA/GET3 family ATPase